MSSSTPVAQEYQAPKAPPELGRPLTAREREVLALFAEGLGTEATAARLEISRVTVRNHSQRILAKLGVHSRLAAVARGRQLGLTRADESGVFTAPNAATTQAADGSDGRNNRT
jgi:DNA-binding NarL/FixJ family response regulator